MSEAPAPSSFDDVLEIVNSMTSDLTRQWVQIAIWAGLLPESLLSGEIGYSLLVNENRNKFVALLKDHLQRLEVCEGEIDRLKEMGEWKEMNEDDRELFKKTTISAPAKDKAECFGMYAEGIILASDFSNENSRILVNNYGNKAPRSNGEGDE